MEYVFSESEQVLWRFKNRKEHGEGIYTNKPDRWEPTSAVFFRELMRRGERLGYRKVNSKEAIAILAATGNPQPSWIDRAAQRIGEGWNANAQMVAKIIREEYGK